MIRRVGLIKLLLGLAVLGSIFAIDVLSVQAMPAFARKYNAPCSSCHTTFPKLNEAGIAFRQRGFRMEDEGPGEHVYSQKHVPIGGMVKMKNVFMDDEASVSPDPNKDNVFSVNEVQLWAGGVLGPNLSFFGDMLGDLDGKSPITPQHFFVILNDVVSDSRVNIKLGAYHMDFPFLSDHRIPTISKYLFRGTATSSEEFAPGTRGGEFNGWFGETGTRYAAGLRKAAVANDTNSMKSYYAWLAQTVELAGFPQTLGVMFLQDRNGDKATNTDDDTSTLSGALDLHFGLTGLVLAFVQYEGGVSEANVEIDSGTAELLHAFTENIVGVARYDFQDISGSSAEKTQIVVNLQYYLLTNVKAELEFAQITTTSAAGVETDNTKGIFQVSLAY